MRNQKGLAAVIAIAVVAAVILFTPIPEYRKGPFLCRAGGPCPQEGWQLGPSLFQKFIVTIFPFEQEPAIQVAAPSLTDQRSNNSDETADWKTYTFERTNSSVPKFQINYPSVWDYREISAGDPVHINFYTSSVGKLSRQVNDTSKADDPSLPQPLNAPIEIRVTVGAVDLCPCEDVTIAGLPAKKIMTEYWEIVELVRDDYTFSIMRSLKDGVNVDSSLTTEKEIEIFNNMLSTFKFTN